MVRAVLADALHANASAVATTDGDAPGDGGARWLELTERDVARLVSAGLQLENVPDGQRIQDTYCYQYIRPWQQDLPVQVLRLLAEVLARSETQANRHALMTAQSRSSGDVMAVHDIKRRASGVLMMARSVASDTSGSDTAASSVGRCRRTESRGQEGDKADRVSTPENTDSELESQQREMVCKAETSSPQVAVPQPTQSRQEDRTPEQLPIAARKRLRVTISPPVLPSASRQAPALQLRSPSRWVSPKVERCLEDELQQPPRKTRKLSKAGRRCSIMSYVASALRAMFMQSDSKDDDGEASSGATEDSEVDPESDASSELSSDGSSELESGSCGSDEESFLDDMQEVLEPIWNALETTSSRFQSVWGEIREFSSSLVKMSAPLHQLQRNSNTLMETDLLVYQGDDFGDGDDWTNPVESGKLAVRTRRQCKEMRRLNAAWRLW